MFQMLDKADAAKDQNLLMIQKRFLQQAAKPGKDVAKPDVKAKPADTKKFLIQQKSEFACAKPCCNIWFFKT